MEKKLIVVNYPGELKDFVVENHQYDYDFLYLKQNKGYNFSNKLLKEIIKNNYKEVIVFGTAGCFDESRLGNIYSIDRCFLFENDIVENQKLAFHQENNILKSANINTVFHFGNYPENISFFGELVDMESFWVASISTQLSTKITIIKGATDIVDSNKSYPQLLQDKNFQENIQKINEKFDKFLRGESIDYEKDNISNKGFNIFQVGENWSNFFENPTNDYFNPEKDSLNILQATKKGEFIRETPNYYGPPGSKGYAVLRGYNCLGACHYCYLQSYFKSPDVVNFLNIDEYIDYLKDFIKDFQQKNPGTPLYFYDGDFQDSFSYHNLEENIDNLNKFIDLIDSFENVYFELRTKCIKSNIEKNYKNLKIGKNTIYAITFSPENIIQKYEEKVADLETRIEFAKYIVSRGGKIGIRIDPFIFDKSNLDKSISYYEELIDNIYKYIDKSSIFNIGIGVLRLKESLYKKLKKSGSGLINNLTYENGFYKYDKETRNKIYDFLMKKFEGVSDKYICMDEDFSS